MLPSQPKTHKPFTVWFKGMNEEEKKNFEDLLRNSKTVLGKLKQILKEEYENYNHQETTLSDFENPNWAYRQAYRNGRKSQLLKTQELLGFIDD